MKRFGLSPSGPAEPKEHSARERTGHSGPEPKEHSASERTGRFGLIGHPVAGSFSPKLFEAAYGGRYPYDLLEGAEFSASWQRFLDEYDGINITAPFKQDAFRAVDALSDDARLCGAVNLAVKTPAGIVGYNTDVAGVVLAVREALAGREAPGPAGLASCESALGEAALGQSADTGADAGATTLASPDTQPVIPGSPGTQPVIPGLTGNLLKEALVVGCGGAGRAAAVAALRLGCRVTLANRTPSRAAALADDLNARLSPIATATSIDTPAGVTPIGTTPIVTATSIDTPAGATPIGTTPIDTPASIDSPVGTNPVGTSDIEPAGAAGSRPVCTWVPVEDLDTLSPDLVIYTVPGPMDGFPVFPEAIVLEANYRTPCLKGCGRTYISGLRWLLFQAVAGYEIFTGETPDADAMFRIFC